MKKIRCLKCGWVVPIVSAESGKTWHCPKCGSPVLEYSSALIVSQNSTCAYCGTKIFDSEISVSCPVCHIEYHEACWKDGEGCQTVGCSNKGLLKDIEIVAPVSESNSTDSFSMSPSGMEQVGEPPMLPFTDPAALETGRSKTESVGFLRMFFFCLLVGIGKIFTLTAGIFRFVEQILSKIGNFYIKTGVALKNG